MYLKNQATQNVILIIKLANRTGIFACDLLSRTAARVDKEDQKMDRRVWNRIDGELYSVMASLEVLEDKFNFYNLNGDELNDRVALFQDIFMSVIGDRRPEDFRTHLN